MRTRTESEIAAARETWRAAAEAMQKAWLSSLDRRTLADVVTSHHQLTDKKRKQVAKVLREFGKAAIDAAAVLDPE